ncbi:hypothetical protein GCM10018965_082240 [Nonomuraea roseola]
MADGDDEQVGYTALFPCNQQGRDLIASQDGVRARAIEVSAEGTRTIVWELN